MIAIIAVFTVIFVNLFMVAMYGLVFLISMLATTVAVATSGLDIFKPLRDLKLDRISFIKLNEDAFEDGSKFFIVQISAFVGFFAGGYISPPAISLEESGSFLDFVYALIVSSHGIGALLAALFCHFFTGIVVSIGVVFFWGLFGGLIRSLSMFRRPIFCTNWILLRRDLWHSF